MEVVNPFILKNKERMIVFLDQLSMVTDPTAPPGWNTEQNSNQNSQDTGIVFKISIYFFYFTYFFYFQAVNSLLYIIFVFHIYRNCKNYQIYSQLKN